MNEKQSTVKTSSIWSTIGSWVSLIFLRVMKALIFIISVPLFLWMLIKNLVSVGITVFIIYLVGSLAFFSFTGQYELMSGAKMDAVLFTDSRFYILSAITVILALVATIGQFRGDID